MVDDAQMEGSDEDKYGGCKDGECMKMAVELKLDNPEEEKKEYQMCAYGELLD